MFIMITSEVVVITSLALQPPAQKSCPEQFVHCKRTLTYPHPTRFDTHFTIHFLTYLLTLPFHLINPLLLYGSSNHRH